MLSNDELARKTMRDGGRRNTITVRDLTFSFVYILLQFAQNGGGTGPTPREVETLHNMRSRQALVPQPAQGQRERILLHPQRKDRYQSFDTYSPHLVTYNGKEYPTSEHLYQAFKVCVYFILFYLLHTRMFIGCNTSSWTIVQTLRRAFGLSRSLRKRPFGIAWRTQRSNTQIGRE
jgi:hypothetical protein